MNRTDVTATLAYYKKKVYTEAKEDIMNEQEIEKKTEELKESCSHCSEELDTSQGDFKTIAIGIVAALAVYAIVPNLLGIRLGDYPTVFVYLGFVAITVVVWMIGEKIKEMKKK